MDLKVQYYCRLPWPGISKQMLKTMKLIAVMLFATFIQVSARGYSQITLSEKNASLQKVFLEIQKQSGYDFVSTYETLKEAGNVTVNVRNVSLQKALEACLKGKPLTYVIIGKTVVVQPKKENYYTASTNLIALEPLPPPVEIHGRVINQKGEPLPKASVLISGTKIGTTTDKDGRFIITAPDDRNIVLEISSVGYQTKYIKVGNQTEINVTLELEVTGLSTVIVTGYGTQRKMDLTGAVAVVDVKDLKNSPEAGVDEMLKGRVPGVTVANNYAPGGGVAVRIRGFSTISNNDPLYVIDGVPTTDNLNTINPNDIASIQVLKDASSASIYGSRAANGVVIITTKKGESGKTKISFNGFTGTQKVFHLPKLLNAQQYGDMLWEATKNDGGTPASDVYGNGSTPVIPVWLDANHTVHSANVDWMNELFHTSIAQSYNLTVSKGTKDAHQYFSLGYYDNDGIMKYTGFKRMALRLNTDNTIFNRLKVGENFTLSYTTNTSYSNNSVNSGVIYDAVKFPSISPVYDINGNFAGSPLNDAWNPLGALYRNRNNKAKGLDVFGNIYADLLVVKDLHLKTNVGLDYKNNNFRNYSPAYFELGTQQSQSTLTTSNSYNYNLVWSNTAEYNRFFGKQNIDLLGGTEAVKFYEEGFDASRIGFPFDDPNFQYLAAGNGGNQTNSGSGNQWTLLSFFGKVNYNYDQRYLLSATIRRDGSSKLGINQWGNFPAFSLGWRVSQESFFHVNFINDLKLRFGWGQNGNQDIPAYSTIESYISDPNNSNYAINGSQNSVSTGFMQSRNANPNLKWETTAQSNYGIDVSMFSSALQVSIDYFIKNTKDLLIQRPLPPVAGGTNQSFWDNAGTMSNKGIEIGLTYEHEINDVSLTLGANFSSYKNRLSSLPSDINFITIPSSTLHTVNFDQEVSRSAAGQPIASFFGYETTGIFQSQDEITKYKLQPNAKPGDLIFADVNHDGVIDGKDRTFIGSPLPKFTYGFNASLKWREFDLSFFIQGSYGNKIYDLTRYYGDFFDLSAYNKFSRVLDAWTPDNKNTSVPRLSLNDPNNNIRPSSYYVKDGSYAKLKNIQIGYNFPERLVHGNLRLYLMAQNLLTITNYDGFDPEVGLQNYSSDDRNLDIGVDRGLYPPSRIYTIGVNVNF